MPALRRLLTFLKQRPRLYSALGVFGVLLFGIWMARLWITTDGGRGWVLSQIDGRSAGGYGTIHAEGLEGDPLGDLTLRRLSVSDTDGDWIIVENVAVDWSPWALTSRLLDIESLSADRVAVLRRPTREPQESSGGGSGFRVQLNTLSIPELSLAEGVAGPEARFGISGDYQQDGQALSARLDAVPLDSGEDKIHAKIDRAATGPFSVDMDIHGAPGGTLATLLGLTGAEGLDLTAAASGDLENAEGDATLRIGETTATTARLRIRDRRLTADLDLNADALPLLNGTPATLIGPAATVRLESTTGARKAPFGIEAKLAAGTLSVRGEANTKTRTLTGPAAIDLALTETQPVLGTPGRLTFTGTAAEDGESWRLQGNGKLDTDGGNLPFKSAEGPLKAIYSPAKVTFSGDLTVLEAFADNATLTKLIGTSAPLSTAGSYDRATGQLTLDKADLGLKSGKLKARGSVQTNSRTLDLKGELTTQLSALPGGYGGTLTAPVTVTGPFATPQIKLTAKTQKLSGLPAPLDDLAGTAPTLTADLTVKDGGLNIASARLNAAKADLTASGRYAWSGTSDLTAQLVQSGAVSLSGWQINLGTADLGLMGPSATPKLTLRTEGGTATDGQRQLTDLKATAELLSGNDTLAGPAFVLATLDGQPVEVEGRIVRASKSTSLTDLSGTLGPGSFTGYATLTDAGGLDANFAIDGTALSWSNGRVEEARGTLQLSRASGEPLEIAADITAEKLRLGPATSLQFDRVTANVRSAPEGYDIRADFQTDDPARPTDLSLIASADFSGSAPAGLFELSGTAFGSPIATASPAHWRLGSSPELDANISILNGQLDAGFTGTGDDTRLVFEARQIDLSPVLALLNTETDRTLLDGNGDLRVFGASPSGTLKLVAASDVPGLNTSIQLNVDGALDAQRLKLNIASQYAGRLTLKGDLTVPVDATAGRLVAIKRTAPLQGRATLEGNLDAVRNAALAFGHDISGNIKAAADLTGTLEQPEVTATADLKDGTYELGSLGFRLSDINLKTGFKDGALTLDANSGAPDGGTFALSGKLAGDDTKLTATFKDLQLYNRDGDFLRGTGNVVLADSKTARTLSGKIFIEQARFSLENLPTSRPQALDVRWTDDPPPDPTQSELRRTTALDLDVTANNRVYITGRGLDSEWKIDLKVTGTPAEPLLDGKTTLVRGDLDLAGRPFVFDTGQIDFDGPASRARMSVTAERSVNGFRARVDVTGSPLKPAFELSSTPDLPQDEILSRLLFGRSSIDLSPLEAAQLASSISRLSGNSSGFDLTGGVQSALGLDRLSIGTSDAGNAEIGVGQYLSDDVYLELKSAAAEGSSVEVEWQPKPQISVTSETKGTGESRLSIRWKKDY